MVSDPVAPYLDGIGPRFLKEPGDGAAVFGGEALTVLDTDNLTHFDAVYDDRDAEIRAQPFSYLSDRLHADARPVLHGAAVFILPLVPEGREEAVKKVAARHVHVDTIKPGRARPDRGICEFVDDLRISQE